MHLKWTGHIFASYFLRPITKLQNKHLDGNHTVEDHEGGTGPALISWNHTEIYSTDRAVNTYKIDLHKVKDHSVVCTVRMLKWLQWIAVNIFTNITMH